VPRPEFKPQSHKKKKKKRQKERKKAKKQAILRLRIGMQNGTATLGNIPAVSSQVNHMLSTQSRNSLLRS
jgi:hypothetical protein